MPIYARKRDANEASIIEALRASGCFVIAETNVDIWVLPPSSNCWVPMEVKQKNGKLTDYQKRLHAEAEDIYGYKIPIVRSIEDALEVAGLIPPAND